MCYNRCGVPGCSTKYGKGLMLRGLPKDPEVQRKWISVLPVGVRLTPSFAVCELHFEVQEFEKIRHDGKKKLKATAVPSIWEVQHITCKEDLPPIIAPVLGNRDHNYIKRRSAPSERENNVVTVREEITQNNKEERIPTHDEFALPVGDMHEVGTPRLYQSAVPWIFPNPPKYLVSPTIKKRPALKPRSPPEKRQRQDTCAANTDQQQKSSGTDAPTEKSSPAMQLLSPKSLLSNIDANRPQVVEPARKNESSNRPFTIECLHEKAAIGVKLPGQMWAVFQDSEDKTTVFSHMTKECTIDKAVKFTDSLTPEIRLCQKPIISFVSESLQSLVDVETLLRIVNSLRPCVGFADEENSPQYAPQCFGYIGKNTTLECTRCAYCSVVRKAGQHENREVSLTVKEEDPWTYSCHTGRDW